MKTVFPSHELAHVWAHQTQSQGRCPSSMSFNGRDFYSYRTVIARILDDGSVVIATDRYSPTTTKHQSYVRQAVNHMARHWVPRIESPYELLRSHTHQVQRLCEKAALARTKREAYMLEAASLALNLNGYLDAIKHNPLERAPLVDTGMDLAAIREQIKQREAEKLAERKAYDARRAMSNKEIVDSWLAGGDHDYRIRHAGVMLRVKGDLIETTQGASVPVEAALKMYALIKAGVGRRLHGHTIGNYTVNNCTANDLTIGCHVIPMSEISRIAEQLNA